MTEDLRSTHRRDWYSYYSEKRIVHQWFQVKLLENLPVHRILEIGPAYGVPTALLATAGFEVTTLDLEDRSLIGAVGHITANLKTIDARQLAGYDCILCCEVLEHLPFETSCRLLKTFSESDIPYLVMSVPYQGPQLGFSLYVNPFTTRKTTTLRFANALRRFRRQPPGGHQWEIGYKGYPLERLEKEVTRAGWRLLNRRFTAGTRSVFLIAANTSLDDPAVAGHTGI